jgi:predicted PurR-regulated permease PerM
VEVRHRGRDFSARWLAILVVYLVLFGFFVFLVLQVVPPIIREFESLGAKAPGYVQDFRQWANHNQDSRT